MNVSITYSEKVVGGRVGVGVTATYNCMVEGQGLVGGGILRTCEPSGDSNVTKTGEWSDGANPMCERKGRLWLVRIAHVNDLILVSCYNVI